MSLDFRALTESDVDAILDVRVRSFGPLLPGETAEWHTANRELMDQGRSFGVFVEGVLAACGKARGFEQAWHGQLVPMAGMAGITVLPEFRGRGIASHLMRGLVDVSVARGEPVSALYPATVTLYRQLGWELVGALARYRLASAPLRALGGSAEVRRIGRADIDAVRALCAEGLARDHASGALLRSAQSWQRLVEDRDTFAYCTDDGAVAYRWDGTDLAVDFLWAATEDSARRLWSVVGSGSSVAKRVHAYLSPDDPVFWLLPQEAGHEVTQHQWMLRILDVGAALGARGYPAGAAGRVSFTVEDAESAGNSGGWLLEVSGGRGSAQRTAPLEGAVTLDARGMAGLYAGRPLSVLRRAGLARGGDVANRGSDAALDAVFATSRPYLTDYF